MKGFVQKKSKAIKEAIGKADEMMNNHADLMKSYEKNYEKIMKERMKRYTEKIQKHISLNICEITQSDKSPFQVGDSGVTRERMNDKCSICLCEMHSAGDQSGMLISTSCNHLFNAVRLASFERYTPPFPHKCPTCRSAYDKRPLI